MKKTFLVFMALWFVSACIIYIPQQEGETYPYPYEEEYGRRTQAAELSEVYLYDYLGRYGIWVHIPPHGYVWLPQDVHYGWRPYTRGRWVWTDYGWTWISRYTWGWIPFHYGRWGWDNQLGWFWVTGYTWGPAWVAWRMDRRYIGWAPLPPDIRFDPGFGIRRLTYDIPARYWVFVEGSYIYSDRIYRYVLPPERNQRIIRTTVSRTEIIARDNRIVNRGVDIEEIRRYSGEPVTKYQLEDASGVSPSRLVGNRVRIYRPEVERAPDARPPRIWNKEEARERVAKERIQKTRKDEDWESRQEREKELLKKTQEEEIRDLKERLGKKEKTKTEEKKQREKEKPKEIRELEKRHEVEKSEMKKRQSSEAEKVKKSEKKEKKEKEKSAEKKKKKKV